MACATNCNRDVVACENDCPDETTCDVTFLVLNSYYKEEARLFTWGVGSEGRTETVKEFKEFYGEGTSADTACSLLYKGQMYIFGGSHTSYPNERQISVIDGCRLSLVFCL